MKIGMEMNAAMSWEGKTSCGRPTLVMEPAGVAPTQLGTWEPVRARTSLGRIDSDGATGLHRAVVLGVLADY